MVLTLLLSYRKKAVGHSLPPWQRDPAQTRGLEFQWSVQRRPTLRGSSQKRVYTSHIRGVSPTEAWRTEEKKALLFTHSDALVWTPRNCPQQGHRHLGSLCQPLHFREFHCQHVEDLICQGAQETLVGGARQRRGRSPPQASKVRCLLLWMKVSSFLDKPTLPVWFLPDPISCFYTHRSVRVQGCSKEAFRGSGFSFYLRFSANLDSG